MEMGGALIIKGNGYVRDQLGRGCKGVGQLAYRLVADLKLVYKGFSVRGGGKAAVDVMVAVICTTYSCSGMAFSLPGWISSVCNPILRS